MWYIYTTEYYLTSKMNEAVVHAMTRLNPEDINLHKNTQKTLYII